mmetsp:Transcript_10120/g.33187  ORF Transcript_10120/g.33187 Transcript_10120/m.33187 type:complete len:232 (-) Transcript_10120:977-1672(-)
MYAVVVSSRAIPIEPMAPRRCAASVSGVSSAPLEEASAPSEPAASPTVKDSFARVAAWRTSGCWCSSALSSSGPSLGTNGARSRVSSTRAQMLPHVIVAFFLSSMKRSWSPRMMTGKMTASAAASTGLQNVVSISLSRHASVHSAGLCSASTTRFIIPFTSGFSITSHTGRSVASATSATLVCVSFKHSSMIGNAAGMCRLSSLGVVCAMSPRYVSAHTLTRCDLSSIPLR